MAMATAGIKIHIRALPSASGKRPPERKAPPGAAGYAAAVWSRQLDPHAVQCARERGSMAMIAAMTHVLAAEGRADDWDEEAGPLWTGWALHRAFLAGIDWQKKQG